MTKIIVAGGRDFSDYKFLSHCIDGSLSQRNISEPHIISGGARGADCLAIHYAREHNVPYTVFPAQWDKYGKSAGFIRNNQMAKFALENSQDKPVLIAFWDGLSSGTKGMIDLARHKGFDVVVFPYRLKGDD